MVQNGDVFFVQENGEYTVYKLIQTGEQTTHYTKVYWPTDAEPTLYNWRSLDLRTACEAFQLTDNTQLVVIAHEPVSEEELWECANFLRISEGLKHRTENFQRIVQEGNQCVTEEDYSRAIVLFTEAMSYSKHTLELFNQRGYCFAQLGRDSEAMADFEHSLSVNPHNSEVLAHCVELHLRMAQLDKAREKVELLQALDSTYAGLQDLTQRINVRH